MLVKPLFANETAHGARLMAHGNQPLTGQPCAPCTPLLRDPCAV